MACFWVLQATSTHIVMSGWYKVHLCIFAPTILLPHLCLLLRSEIIDNVELLTDLFSVFAFDHRSNLGTSQIKETLDVQIVRSKDQLKQ